MTECGDKNNGITVQSKPYVLGILRILTNDCPAVNKYSPYAWTVFPLQLAQLLAT